MYILKIEEVCRSLQCLLEQDGVEKPDDDGRLGEGERKSEREKER